MIIAKPLFSLSSINASSVFGSQQAVWQDQPEAHPAVYSSFIHALRHKTTFLTSDLILQS